MKESLRIWRQVWNLFSKIMLNRVRKCSDIFVQVWKRFIGNGGFFDVGMLLSSYLNGNSFVCWVLPLFLDWGIRTRVCILSEQAVRQQKGQTHWWKQNVVDSLLLLRASRVSSLISKCLWSMLEHLIKYLPGLSFLHILQRDSSSQYFDPPSWTDYKQLFVRFIIDIHGRDKN